MRGHAYPSFQSIYETQRPDFLCDRRETGQSLLSLVHIRQPAIELTDPQLPEILLAVSLGREFTYRCDLGEGWTPDVLYRPGALDLSPPNTDISLDYAQDNEFIILGFDVEQVSHLLDEYSGLSIDALEPLYAKMTFAEPVIANGVHRLWKEAEPGGMASRLLTDGLAHELLGRLLRLADGITDEPCTKHKLDDHQLSLVLDYIHENYHRPISLDELARVAGRSQFHFSRRFKERTGQSPHQYVINRRIALAQRLLREERLPIAEIAYACGFSSQSHLTDMFRRRIGITPGRYREDWGK